MGTENQNLPGFVVMLDPRGGPISGPTNWSSGFMPASYQATVMRSSGDPILDLKPDGSFRLDMGYFDYCTGLAMMSFRAFSMVVSSNLPMRES